jgi:hypothetical protein
MVNGRFPIEQGAILAIPDDPRNLALRNALSENLQNMD